MLPRLSNCWNGLQPFAAESPKTGPNANRKYAGALRASKHLGNLRRPRPLARPKLLEAKARLARRTLCSMAWCESWKSTWELHLPNRRRPEMLMPAVDCTTKPLSNMISMNSQHISTPFTCAAWCQDAIVQHVIPANLCCPTVKYVLLFCGHRMPFYQTFSVMYYLVNTFFWGTFCHWRDCKGSKTPIRTGKESLKADFSFLRAPGAKRRWHGSTTSLQKVGSLCPHGSPVDRTTGHPVALQK